MQTSAEAGKIMMTDQGEPGSREAHAEIAAAARQGARRAVLDIVRKSGGSTVTRPMFRDRPDLGPGVPDAEAIAGIRAARQVEHAARQLGLEYVRKAREDGHSWHEIGAALELGADAAQRGVSLAEAAYDYAADEPSSTYDPRSVPWTCPACLEVISDRGPDAGHPADAEPGHADSCTRLAATIAAWHASWGEES
jgi:hypothetical protein